ncbi:DUF460 domain-containing protein [Candidatus Woesearchaeota archaeon]|nr:DUF460 domain-containing protein [Candidatus Woesearchaeota archaeon]
MTLLIIGLDPGTTTGYAVLDTDGKFLAADSKKNYPLSNIIFDIYKFGTPLIIGTDKKEIPSFIKQFSQKTGAKMVTPKQDMKKGEKKRIVSFNRLLKKVKNIHEIDSLASAIYAYDTYKTLISKIKKYLKKENKLYVEDQVLEQVILNERSINKALEFLEKKPEKKVVKKKEKAVTIRKDISREQKQIKLLEKQNQKLKSETTRLKKELKRETNKTVDIDAKTKRLLSFKEQRILFLEKTIENLLDRITTYEEKLSRLNNFINKLTGNILVKKLPNFGSRINTRNIMKRDILLVDNIGITSSKIIAELKNKIEILIYKKNRNKALANDFILIPQNALKIIEIEEFALVDEKSLRDAIKEIQKNKFNASILKDILDEYKRERG